MLPIHQIEVFLQYAPAHLQDIVLELRNIVAAVAMDADEVIRWGGLSYFHKGRGGLVSAGICQIEIKKDHIRLAFIHGSFLSEPRGLFEGGQKYKRYIKLRSYDDTPWNYLKQLIEEATQFDPRSLQV
jgi:hypothetical protein